MSRGHLAYLGALALVGGIAALTPMALPAQEKAVANAVKAAALTNPAAEKALAVVNQLRQAINSGDALLAERTMAESVSIFEQGHAEKSRAEYLSHHFKADVAFAKAVPSVVVASQAHAEPTMALITAHTTTDGVYKDKPIKNAGVETYVLRLQGGIWLIEHIHWSSTKR